MNTETLLTASKWILIIGTILVALGTLGVGHFTAKSDQVKDRKIDSLLSSNQRLEDGNLQLLKNGATYQADLAVKQKEIETLKVESARAKRGLISQWDFNGARRQQSAGRSSVSAGPEIEVFQELGKLQKDKKFDEIIILATTQIAKTPDWLTPYFYRAIARGHLGQQQKAVEDLKYVVDVAAGDPAYAQAAEMLKIQRQTGGTN